MEINGNADEESIADIFVRVNSGGKALGEDDFILTLISVYWQEGRQKIEDFCRSAKIPKQGTAYNFLFEPSPTHIVRMAMSYGFQRARLHYAYMLLRGRDFDNGVYSDALRVQQFDKLKTVLDKVLNVQVWKNFIKCIEAAGFVSKTLISSENALVYSYAMYLIGKFDYGMEESALRKLIAKWFFMCSTLHTRELFSPTADGSKSALERHHLFPKTYLARIGITDDRDRNQTANFAFIEWSDNIEILDTSPAEYMKDQLAKIPADEKDGVYAVHALPDGWEQMKYADFLSQRRGLMAKVIKRGYERLK
ncbi:hypothetical protein [Pelotomaculum sp. FP]|uniref:hypothetical protein n=1 Tax=Pelotomaculum sp. FP TaxID=261474 RepID=UPI0010666C5D|nr:hypothetical protein [Pelotomaculum sp. FP]